MFTLSFDINGMEAQAHNTGAGYTLLGQIIYTVRLPSGAILVCDASRGLDYVYSKYIGSFDEAIKAYRRNSSRVDVAPEDRKVLEEVYTACRDHLFRQCEEELRNLPT